MMQYYITIRGQKNKELLKSHVITFRCEAEDDKLRFGGILFYGHKGRI